MNTRIISFQQNINHRPRDWSKYLLLTRNNPFTFGDEDKNSVHNDVRTVKISFELRSLPMKLKCYYFLYFQFEDFFWYLKLNVKSIVEKGDLLYLNVAGIDSTSYRGPRLINFGDGQFAIESCVRQAATWTALSSSFLENTVI